MPAQELSGTTALVTGASRGFGRAIAIALARHGTHAAGVARDRTRLEELRAQLGDTFTPSPPTPPTRWPQASSSASTAPARAPQRRRGPPDAAASPANRAVVAATRTTALRRSRLVTPGTLLAWHRLSTCYI